MKRNKIFPLALLYLCVVCSALNAQTVIHVSGNISTNTTWGSDTVKVDSTVTVNRNITLTIEAGTYVEFQGYFPLMISGVLRAIGTDAEPIIFTVRDTTGFSIINLKTGAWHGIRFDNLYGDQDTSVLEYCTIEYSKAVTGGEEDYKGGGINLMNKSRLHISNCILKNNFSTGDGGGIYIEESYVKIINNKFLYNRSRMRGGGLSAWSSEMEITNNLICNNYAGSGGGIKIQDCDPVIANNIICNNEAEEEGGGLWIYSCDPVSINNTICFNKAGMGGGMYVGIQSRPVSYNNIIWGNEAPAKGNQVFLSDFNPEIRFYNCNIQGGDDGFGLEPGSVYFGKYMNNIDTIPGFEAPPPGAGNDQNGADAGWALLPGSPCINKGTNTYANIYLPPADYGFNKRISYSLIDIGAYEFNLPVLEVCGTIDENTTWTADTIKVNCDINVPDTYTLTINAGACVRFQGPYKIEVHGTFLSLGTRSDSVIFTINDTTGFSDITTGNGGWRGMEFYSFATNDSSKILYSRLEYGKKVIGDPGNETSGGAILASSCYRLLISNSTLRRNMSKRGGAISCTNSPITIINSTISRNRSVTYRGGGIDCVQSNAKITGCQILNNTSPNAAGGIFVINCDPIIRDCIIRNNIASGYGGGIHTVDNSRPLISGNDISFNTAGGGGGLALESGAIAEGNIISNNQAGTGGGIFARTDLEIILANNIICNNSANYYGAMQFGAGKSRLINNTIVNNYAVTKYGGIDVYRPGMTIENTILWGNTAGENNIEIHVGNPGANPDIIYSNIQGGIESVYYSGGLQGEARYEHNIDSLPLFVLPTDSAGIHFDGTTGDWSLMATSPCINSGNPAPGAPEVLPSDYIGNPRIHSSVIDMGALENQSGIPVVTEQPLNYTRCTGDSVEMFVEVAVDAFYQWQLNQTDIPGATRKSYKIDSITPGHDGNYQCIIHNTFGTVKSNPALLRVKSPPEILLQPENTWAQLDKKSTIEVFAGGTEPSYQWRKNGIEVDGQILNEFSIPQSGYKDEGSYDCIISNGCGAVTTDPASLFLVPQICMVTVSSSTGQNLVVWEKKSIAPILAYNVYRESAAAGIYDKLETVSHDELSVYVDTVADPTTQAYLYRITAIDTAGHETDIDLCKPHKTVHLIVSTNPELNTTQLQWDRYYGFDYQTYIVYRRNTGLNFDPVQPLSASLNSWTDPNPVPGDLYYRIAVEKLEPCVPEGNGKKAGTAPYQHSLSNLDDNKLKLGQLPPDTIVLTNNSIEEEKQPGTMIGKLLTEDKDSIDSHMYQFVPGDGDDDNISFTLLGDLLFASESFDFETKNTYSIRIRSTDLAGNYCEVPFPIQVLDVDETTGLPVRGAGGMKAFPNPFGLSTTITFPNPGAESYKMTITDPSGKICRIVDNITASEYVLKKGDLKGGLYFIGLTGPRTFRIKIMIK